MYNDIHTIHYRIWLVYSMRLIDISVPISASTPVWPGDPRVAVRMVASIDDGADANVSQIRMSVHTGTHIDAPKHFFPDGAAVDQIELQRLVGRTLLIAFDPATHVINASALKNHPGMDQASQFRKILFKTSNSNFWGDEDQRFREDYVGIDESGAAFLAELQLDLVGIDYLSIAPFSETRRPHEILLGKDIILLEGLNLSEVPEGIYQLVCCPLLIAGCEGAPARAILIDNQ